MQELLETLRPGLQLHDSYEAAAAAVEALEAAEVASQRARGGLPAIAEDEDAGDSGSDERSFAAGSDDEGTLLVCKSFNKKCLKILIRTPAVLCGRRRCGDAL